jgi:hypothetical protein
MSNETVQRDWLSRAHTSALAWWIPKAAIVAALFIAPPARTGIWIIALVWMGTACILNSRRCGRTHCRYTGPYYLAMIAPVLVVPETFPTCTRAREERADLLAKEILEIADAPCKDAVEVTHARNRLDTRRWWTNWLVCKR